MTSVCIVFFLLLNALLSTLIQGNETDSTLLHLL